MNDQLLKAALHYRKMGFSVIPVKKDKKPFIKWEKYQTQKADEQQIRAWWGRWPGANVALVTGSASVIDVIDVDSQAGHDALNEFLPDTLQTPISQTPSGGWHYYFAHKEGLVNATRLITDCDVRTTGGYVVAPPSENGNGQSWAWMRDFHIAKIELAAMPDMLFEILQAGGPDASSSEHNSININTNINASTRRASLHHDNKRQHLTTNDNIRFDEGCRDEALFHLANHLVKGGMPVVNIEKYLTFFASNCNPPFPEKEIFAKISSALKRAENRDRNLTQEIRDLILTTKDNISTTFVYNCQHLTTRDEKKKATVILGRLVKEGLIEPAGQAGFYRKIESNVEAMDFINAKTESLNLWLPFNLHEMIEIMPGNIILIAGEPNAGKTGFLLNVIQGNMRDFEIHYFNSEMGSSELKKRLSNFDDISLSDWNFKAWERSDNFSDVIKPSKGKINIIDFLEIYDNFYEIGGKLAEIHKKLKGAIAIVALQKNPGVDVGLGGFRSIEKPRLALAMSPGTLKIVKAKNWKATENPNGMQVNFKIVQGCNFIQTKNWHKPIKE